MMKDVNAANKTMTFAEAKEKFSGMPLIVMSPEPVCSHDFDDDEDWECPSTCSVCQYCTEYDLALTVKGVFSTRRSFLLRTPRFMFVVSKKDAANFELQPAEISAKLREQVDNIGFALAEEQFIFCRTWRGRTRRYFKGQFDCTFIYPCEREQANCLFIATRNQRCGYDDMRREEKAYGGKADNIQSCYGEECGKDTMDLWRFQYDPDTDELLIPSEELDINIDKMLELMENPSPKKYNLPSAE